MTGWGELPTLAVGHLKNREEEGAGRLASPPGSSTSSRRVFNLGPAAGSLITTAVTGRDGPGLDEDATP